MVLLKILLGLIFVHHNSIDLDEPFSIFHAQKPLSELWLLFAQENNPPLHFYLLHFWIKLFGISALAVRSLSMIFSLMTLLVLYHIGKKLKSETLGLLITLIYISSTYQHYFALEARTYALFSFLFATALYLMISFKEKPNSWKVLLFVLLIALLIYSHYIAILVVPILVLTFVIWSAHGVLVKRLKYGVLIIIATLVLIIPLLSAMRQRIGHVQNSGTWLAAPKWNELYGIFIKYYNGFLPATLVVLLFLLHLLLHRKSIKSNLKKWLSSKWMLIVFPTISIYIGAYLISILTSQTLFFDRYLVFLTVGFYIIFATLVLSSQSTLKFVAFLPVLIFFIGFKPNKSNNRASGTIANYAKSFNSSYVITPTHYDLTFIYHFNKEIFKKQKHGNQLNQHNIFPIYDVTELNLDQLKDTIVLIDADAAFLFGESKVKTQLDTHFKNHELLEKTFEGKYTVYVYSKN